MKTKVVIYVFLDIITVYLSFFLTFFVSLDTNEFNKSLNFINIYSASIAMLVILIFVIFKIYRNLLFNFGLGDCFRLSLCILSSNLVGLIILFSTNFISFNLSNFFAWCFGVIAIEFLILLNRIFPRIFKILVRHCKKTTYIRTMVIGAGDAAKILIDDSRINKLIKNKIIVLVDDDKRKINTLYSNIKVEGPISNVKTIIEKYQIEEVIIAIASLTSERLHQILRILSECDVRVKRMPIISEMVGPNDTSVINVDIDELLNRDLVDLDNKYIGNIIVNQTVLITGAGGSIGSELVRQIFYMRPKTLILFDIYENSTYEIQQELIQKMRRGINKNINLIVLIGSTYNDVRVEQIIKKYRPQYIYHAAAYKHVPLMEDSPVEAIRTNVIGTYNVAKFANKYSVKKMILVSTDKAVRPTNVMGATKRFAEMIIQYFSSISKNTIYSAVRFGNVLGSNGSVIPLFKKQILEGGPITITHKDVIRYFMTIPEAVSLILQCGLYANGGEIFILDMGKPVKIYDLAIKLIHQAGLVPNKDIKIIEIGLRPGEKLFEELLINKKTQKKTPNNRIYIEKPESVKPIVREIKTISKVFDIENNSDIKKILSSIVDSYRIKI